MKGKVTFSDGKAYDFHVGPGGVYIRFYFYESRNGASFAHGFFSLRREKLLHMWLEANDKVPSNQRGNRIRPHRGWM